MYFAHRLGVNYGEEVGIDGVLLEGGAKTDLVALVAMYLVELEGGFDAGFTECMSTIDEDSWSVSLLVGEGVPAQFAIHDMILNL